jgi:hypothetical protein
MSISGSRHKSLGGGDWVKFFINHILNMIYKKLFFFQNFWGAQAPPSFSRLCSWDLQKSLISTPTKFINAADFSVHKLYFSCHKQYFYIHQHLYLVPISSISWLKNNSIFHYKGRKWCFSYDLKTYSWVAWWGCNLNELRKDTLEPYYELYFSSDCIKHWNAHTVFPSVLHCCNEQLISPP